MKVTKSQIAKYEAWELRSVASVCLPVCNSVTFLIPRPRQ